MFSYNIIQFKLAEQVYQELSFISQGKLDVNLCHPGVIITFLHKWTSHDTCYQHCQLEITPAVSTPRVNPFIISICFKKL